MNGLPRASPAAGASFPIALAAREAKGPALMQLTRWPHLRPTSQARTRVSLSSAALALDIPPPYPGMTRSLARYDKLRKALPGRMSGARRWTRDTIEYALTLTAARYPRRLVSIRSLETSGPLASE